MTSFRKILSQNKKQAQSPDKFLILCSLLGLAMIACVIASLVSTNPQVKSVLIVTYIITSICLLALTIYKSRINEQQFQKHLNENRQRRIKVLEESRDSTNRLLEQLEKNLVISEFLEKIGIHISLNLRDKPNAKGYKYFVKDFYDVQALVNHTRGVISKLGVSDFYYNNDILFESTGMRGIIKSFIDCEVAANKLQEHIQFFSMSRIELHKCMRKTVELILENSYPEVQFSSVKAVRIADDDLRKELTDILKDEPPLSNQDVIITLSVNDTDDWVYILRNILEGSKDSNYELVLISKPNEN